MSLLQDKLNEDLVKFQDQKTLTGQTAPADEQYTTGAYDPTQQASLPTIGTSGSGGLLTGPVQTGMISPVRHNATTAPVQDYATPGAPPDDQAFGGDDRVYTQTDRTTLGKDAPRDQMFSTQTKTVGDVGDGSSYTDKYGKTQTKPISWVWNPKTQQYTDKQTGIVYGANGQKLNTAGEPTGTGTGPNVTPGGTGGDGGGDAGGGGGTGGDGGSGTGGHNIWDPIGTGEDPMQFNTIPGDVAEVPVPEYYEGDGGPAIGTGEQVDGMTVMNPDGSVSPGTVDPTTREVQDEELVANQMSSLLNSDSKFMQDARRQGLEQSNAMGGLGGTAAVGAAMQSAMRSALPIATADAQAFRDAAAQNMDALNNFAQLNHQRATQMELANVDAKTRQEITSITTSAQMAAAALESATQRDISMLDAETKLRAQEMAAQMQHRLADQAFRHNALLADQKAALDAGLLGMKGDYDLAGIGLGGDYQLEDTAMKAEIENRRLTLEREATHARIASDAYSTYMGHITDMNGQEMDDAARTRAYASAENAFKSHLGLINSLYPDLDPITF